MAHVGHIQLKTKPGSFQKVCDRYKQFTSVVLAHNADLHDLIIVGNQAQNTIEGFGIYEDASHAAALEDTQDFATFMADVANDLAEPINRNDLVLLYRMNPKP
jgi:quinol monooxygenase YgiN